MYFFVVVIGGGWRSQRGSSRNGQKVVMGELRVEMSGDRIPRLGLVCVPISPLQLSVASSACLAWISDVKTWRRQSIFDILEWILIRLPGVGWGAERSVAVRCLAAVNGCIFSCFRVYVILLVILLSANWRWKPITKTQKFEITKLIELGQTRTNSNTAKNGITIAKTLWITRNERSRSNSIKLWHQISRQPNYGRTEEKNFEQKVRKVTSEENWIKVGCRHSLQTDRCEFIFLNSFAFFVNFCSKVFALAVF